MQASDINLLNALHGDAIEISSSSYELPLFSLKDGSGHGAGEGTTPGESSSVSIGDL
jgi:hypothetical protein